MIAVLDMQPGVRGLLYYFLVIYGPSLLFGGVAVIGVKLYAWRHKSEIAAGKSKRK